LHEKAVDRVSDAEAQKNWVWYYPLCFVLREGAYSEFEADCTRAHSLFSSSKQMGDIVSMTRGREDYRGLR